MEKLTAEAEALGFYLSAHPLDAFEAVFERMRVANSADLTHLVQVAGASRVQLAAIVSDVKERISQKGNKFGIISATDKSGAFEVLCFAEALATHREKLRSGQPLLLGVFADKKTDEDRLRLSLNSVELLSEVMAKTASTVIVTVEKVEAVEALKAIFERLPVGKSRVFMMVKTADFVVELSVPGKFFIAPDALEKMGRVSGVIEVKQV